MRLLELEISNTRGIRHVTLFPNGDNFVVWGPNGSGKSAVVDSIDFLLTGRMTRLTGKGTGAITLSKYGSHIDCDPKDAKVRALVKLRGAEEPIMLERCVARPDTLESDQAGSSELTSALRFAHIGQHVLTRREILKYITAEGSKRAEEIQALLNITEIEEVRKSLVKTQGDLGKDAKAAKHNLEVAQAAVSATIQKPARDASTVLSVVNQSRAVIGAAPITELHSTQLKSGTTLPVAASDERPVNVTLLEGDVAILKKVSSTASRAEVSANDAALRTAVSELGADPSLLRAFSQLDLILLGIELIDESGTCPLCDAPWEDGRLHAHLRGKLAHARAATPIHQRLITASTTIRDRVAVTLASLKQVCAVARLVGLDEDVRSLESWQRNLQILADASSTPVDRYLASGFGSEEVTSLLAPGDLDGIAARVLSVVKRKFPGATPEQTAWDTLTRLEENLKAQEKAEAEHRSASMSYERASLAAVAFERARDGVLKEIYDAVKDRFVGLYKELHGADESGFEARLEPDGAALNMEVGFYGRGTHPPHALHSEGHQDSMGLCLYLALAERLTEGVIDLIILDDVVMSVDADHRKNLCSLLAKEFPNRQFLITTHDRTWAEQLRTEGVATNKGCMIEFRNWKVDTGPQVDGETGAQEKIELALQNNDVPGASAKLRWEAERFFRLACDSLRARVTFRIDGRWELGDFMPAAYSQYKDYLKKAKHAAQSWGDKESMDLYSELESVAAQIYGRTQAEQWAVNASVHYNSWANLCPNDFRPVADAFKDLFAVYTCSKCGAMLYTTFAGLKVTEVRCKCGKVNWNLQEK